jgi:hypothetical protein
MSRLRRAFGVVARPVLQDPTLSLSAKTLYCLLCTYADDDGVCYPSNETLAAALGVTDRSIRTWLGELIEAKVLARDERYVNNRQVTSVTRLTDSEISARPEPTFPPGGEPGFLQNKTTMNKTTNYYDRPPLDDIDEAFRLWWDWWPRKDGRKEAKAAYEAAVAAGATTREIEMGMLVQLHELKQREKRYIPLAATWLNRKGWLDHIQTKAQREYWEYGDAPTRTQLIDRERGIE